MFLKIKIGRYAGEIREFAPDAGRALLQSGRAENPYAPTPRIVAKPQRPARSRKEKPSAD